MSRFNFFLLFCRNLGMRGDCNLKVLRLIFCTSFAYSDPQSVKRVSESGDHQIVIITSSKRWKTPKRILEKNVKKSGNLPY